MTKVFSSTVVVVVLAGASVLAQDPQTKPTGSGSLFDRTKQLNEIAARKIEADVRLAIKEAARIRATDADQAIEKLRTSLVQLEGDKTLSSERRDTLVRIVNDRIRIAESGVDTDEQLAAARSAQEAREASQKARDDKVAEESKKIKSGLAAVSELRKQGKTAEAKKRTEELLKEYPDNLVVQIAAGSHQIRQNLKDAEDLKKDKDQRTVAAIRDIDRSSIPAIGDVEFPKDWKERTARRNAAQQISPQERELIQKLESPIDATFKGSRFQDVIDYISTSMGRTIIIEKSALDESNITYDTPVTFATKSVISVRAALRSILSNLNLTYVVRDNVIYVTTPQRAKDMMVTRVYYLGDLVAGAGPLGGTPMIGPVADHFQLAQNVAFLIEAITSSIDPMSWENKRSGGSGTIGFNLATLSLIVRQSQEVHAMIRDSALYRRR